MAASGDAAGELEHRYGERLRAMSDAIQRTYFSRRHGPMTAEEHLMTAARVGALPYYMRQLELPDTDNIPMHIPEPSAPAAGAGGAEPTAIEVTESDGPLLVEYLGSRFDEMGKIAEKKEVFSRIMSLTRKKSEYPISRSLSITRDPFITLKSLLTIAKRTELPYSYRKKLDELLSESTQRMKEKLLLGATKSNNMPAVKILLDHGLAMNRIVCKILARYAGILGDIDFIRWVLDIRPEGFGIGEFNVIVPETILKYAVEYGHLPAVKYLVGIGANPRMSNSYLLRVASKHGWLDIVEYLVSEGCDIRAADDEAIILAHIFGHNDIIRYFQSFGLNPPKRGYNADLYRNKETIFFSRDDITFSAI